nr:hypothetical protein [Tanacetum cinerariifolium]
MHLHANVVRFERTPFQQSQPPPPTRPGKIAPSFVSAVKAEGFSIQKVVYLGGLWVMFELPSANSKSKFLAQIIVKGKSFVVRAKELFVWSPSFVEVIEADDTHEEGEFIQNGEEGLAKPIHQTNVEEESDIEGIFETFFGDQADDLYEVVDSAQQSIPKETSYDPFNIYDILN